MLVILRHVVVIGVILHSATIIGVLGDVREVLLTSPGFELNKHDEYICVSLNISHEDAYITQFVPLIPNATVHHVLVFACADAPAKPRRDCYYPCPSSHGPILFGWGNEAPALMLPKDVSFKVGGSHPILVAQFHYKEKVNGDRSSIAVQLSSNATERRGGIYMMMHNTFRLEAGWRSIVVKASCQLEHTITVFAVRVHAHSLATSISVWYRLTSTADWKLLFVRNPQRPQSFIPLQRRITLSPGYELLTKCDYDTSGRTEDVRVGMGAGDEMCNAYLMYEAFDPAKVPDMCAKPYLKYAPEQSCTLVSPPEWKPLIFPDSHNNLTLGQVSGIAMNGEELLVLHRGRRLWTNFTFYANGTYRGPANPEPEPLLIRFNVSRDFEVVSRDIAGQLMLPHGLSLSQDGRFILITDIATNEVLQYAAPTDWRSSKYERTDDRYPTGLCKPSGAVLLRSKQLLVADGYCARRLATVYSNSAFKWLSALRFNASNIPSPIHCIVQDLQYVLLCDREQGSIYSYNVDKRRAEISFKLAGLDKLYALANAEDRLFAAGFKGSKPVLTLYMVTQLAATIPIPAELIMPHSLAYGRGRLYIGDLTGKQVWHADITEYLDCSVLHNAKHADELQRSETSIAIGNIWSCFVVIFFQVMYFYS